MRSGTCKRLAKAIGWQGKMLIEVRAYGLHERRANSCCRGEWCDRLLSMLKGSGKEEGEEKLENNFSCE